MSGLGNQPAYPHTRHCSDRGIEWMETVEGLTKRELFAAMIFQQFLAGATLPPGFDASEQLAFAAARATESADLLLAELAKEPQP